MSPELRAALLAVAEALAALNATDNEASVLVLRPDACRTATLKTVAGT